MYLFRHPAALNFCVFKCFVCRRMPPFPQVEKEFASHTACGVFTPCANKRSQIPSLFKEKVVDGGNISLLYSITYRRRMTEEVHQGIIFDCHFRQHKMPFPAASGGKYVKHTAVVLPL
jgi:hypothetical protein